MCSACLARCLLLHKAQEGLAVQRGSGARTHVEQDSESTGLDPLGALGPGCTLKVGLTSYKQRL